MTVPLVSPRQIEILALVAEGMTNSQIGNQLQITTVACQLRRAFIRLGARDRSNAVLLALRAGVIA